MDERHCETLLPLTGKPVGVVYDNSPYYFFWLICAYGKMGAIYLRRVVYPHKSNGVVVIPLPEWPFWSSCPFSVIPRLESGGEFPEALGRIDSSGKRSQGALGRAGCPHCPRRNWSFGEIRADTGISAGKVQIFCAQVGK